MKIRSHKNQLLLASLSETLGGNGEREVEFGAKEFFDGEDDAPQSVWDTE